MKHPVLATCLRRLLLCWLTAVCTEYLLLPPDVRSLSELSGLQEMSFPRLLILTAALYPPLLLLSRRHGRQRWCLFGLTGLLLVTALFASFSWAFFGASLLLLGLMLIYVYRGWDNTPTPTPATGGHPCWGWITGGVSLLFFLLICAWGIGRVYSFCSPSYDMGIFSQMFHSMKTTGLPITTLERDGALSHFAVHVSPICYLLLPFYALFPFPGTLQVLQAAVLTSAVIPLWLTGRRHGLSAPNRMLLCLLLLLFPAFSGGTGYDFHENCFLTPLLLWLLWALDTERPALALLFGAGVLLVKEDAGVYAAIVGLFDALRRSLKGQKPWFGLILAGLSTGWFLLVTGYLANQGDGVMTYRYDNFIYDNSGSLLTLIKAVLLCPMKALYECLDTEKLPFLALTLLPLLGLPLLTRRYERWILLIPYILVNLMSDYRYQHEIFYQYTFGSTALLLYLTCVNLADLKPKLPLLLCAAVVSLVCFCQNVLPEAIAYPTYAINAREDHIRLRQALDTIPPDASVTASTFYTTHLSGRAVLYDLQYCSKSHLLESDYVAVSPTAAGLDRYGGLTKFTAMLERSGYSLHVQLDDQLLIFERKP